MRINNLYWKIFKFFLVALFIRNFYTLAHSILKHPLLHNLAISNFLVDPILCLVISSGSLLSSLSLWIYVLFGC